MTEPVSVYICEHQSTEWGQPEILSIWSTYAAADAWLTAYNDARPAHNGQRRQVQEWYLDVAVMPQPPVTDNPDDPDPYDGQFFEGRAEVISVNYIDDRGRVISL